MSFKCRDFVRNYIIYISDGEEATTNYEWVRDTLGAGDRKADQKGKPICLVLNTTSIIKYTTTSSIPHTVNTNH